MRPLVAVLVATALALFASPTLADDGVRSSRSIAFIGEQFEIVIEIATPAGATVDIDPVAPSWAGVEVVRLISNDVTTSGDRSTHRLRVLVAPFLPGEVTVSPGLLVTQGVDLRTVEVPGFALNVTPTLPVDAPLVLSPIAPPRAIGGAESPWLRPAIALGAVSAVLIVSTFGFLAVRLALRLRPARPTPETVAMPPPDLGSAEALLQTDPVLAYRTLGTVVRKEIALRYGFPASALTTRELQQRMEAEGVERWQARLVSGLLQECDAVVYAGYRPAPERREADLVTAREIVGANG